METNPATTQSPELFLRGQALQENYDEMTGAVSSIEQDAEVLQGQTLQNGWGDSAVQDYQEGGEDVTVGQSEAGADSQEKTGFIERTKNKLAILAISAVGLGLGGNAVANADNTERATGPDASASSTKTLGPNALKKLCVKAGLRMPVVEKDDNYLGNYQPSTSQSWTLKAHWKLVPATCNDRYRRVSSAKPEVQNHRNHNQWRAAARPIWTYINRNNRGFGDKDDPNYTEYSEYSYASWTVHKPKSSRLPYYRCTPGAGKTRARIKIRNQIKDEQTGKVVAQRVRKFPTEVVPAC